MWVIVLVLYSVIAIPLDFGFQYDVPDGLFVWDICVDVCFIFDLAINFRTAYYKPDGEIELDAKVRLWFNLGPWLLISKYCLHSLPYPTHFVHDSLLPNTISVAGSRST